MGARVLRPEGKGFLFLDSHPTGCARTVDEMITEIGRVPAAHSEAAAPRVLLIGCSAGYGLATAVAGLFGYRVRLVGVCFERPATGRRSASAGWYRTATLADRAAAAGLQFAAVNGDCFDPAVREDALESVTRRLGAVDVLIYSVAAPRRTDPVTGAVHHSVVKPVGAPYQARNVAFADGAVLRDVLVEPATEAEIFSTVAVMGGADWSAWVADLGGRGLLGPGFQTVALTYVGSDLTAPIYRHGTIGRAKDDLEATARRLTAGMLAEVGGTAVTSVNCAAVTMSSLAIPGISVYLSLLRAVAGDRAQSPIRQSVRLWDHLTGRRAAETDSLGRLRLDDWELAPDVQRDVTARWREPAECLVAGLADLDWFRREIGRLYGFDVLGVDYGVPVEVDVPWPVPPEPVEW
ncbi:MAG TPA: enoyl-[acyl-carrier-protein] reductase FabV [Streptosporangiaceae bacterium]|nr:enoyl-[acyl-carrier-protein] reductase FabV [Streptosporangiaceae bacterium]